MFKSMADVGSISIAAGVDTLAAAHVSRPNSRSSLVSVSVPRAFPPVGAGFFSTPNKNTKGNTWKSSSWPS